MANFNLKIKTIKISAGRYRVEREDGRTFEVFRSALDPKRWVLAAQDDHDGAIEKSLSCCKWSISRGWVRATEAIGLQGQKECSK